MIFCFPNVFGQASPALVNSRRVGDMRFARLLLIADAPAKFSCGSGRGNSEPMKKIFDISGLIQLLEADLVRSHHRVV